MPKWKSVDSIAECSVCALRNGQNQTGGVDSFSIMD